MIAQLGPLFAQSIAQYIAQSSRGNVQSIAQSIAECGPNIAQSHWPIGLPNPNAQSAFRIAQCQLGNPLALSSAPIA